MRLRRAAKTGLKILGLPSVMLVAWQHWAENERRSFPAPKMTPQGNYFFLGSVDDERMDELKTGDLILFRRRWWLLRVGSHYSSSLDFVFAVSPRLILMHTTQQPWGALITYLRLQVCDYDHVGIIIRKGLQKPYILESTYSGVKLRPYDERILWSRARTIDALPLQRRVSTCTYHSCAPSLLYVCVSSVSLLFQYIPSLLSVIYTGGESSVRFHKGTPSPRRRP
jgi:hypothetical protein